MPRPARPPPDLIVIQAHFACGRFEAALNRPSSPGHPHDFVPLCAGPARRHGDLASPGPTRCRAGLTVLPHVVLRDRQRPPAVAREALLAPWGPPLGAGALRCQVSPMALERLSWALGHPRLVAVLTRGERPRPADVLADEQPRHGLTRDSQRRGGHRERGRRWCQDQQAGWSEVRDDPQMPVRSTRRDQAHHAIEWIRVAMQGIHHPAGHQEACLRGLADLDHRGPDQRRARHTGPIGIEVEGGTVPPRDWWLHLPSLTSGGFR